MARKQQLATNHSNKVEVYDVDSQYNLSQNAVDERVKDIQDTYEGYRRKYSIFKMCVDTSYVDDTIFFEGCTDIEQLFWRDSARFALKATIKQREILTYMLNNIGQSKRKMAEALRLSPQAFGKHLQIIQTKITKVFTDAGLKEIFQPVDTDSSTQQEDLDIN